MFVNRLINQGNLPVVEQKLRFHAARHEVLAENIANLTTPGYQRKDLDEGKFQEALRSRVESRRGQPTSTVRFDNLSKVDVTRPTDAMLFHDGNNRSVEQLMTDFQKNALTHNLFVELMKRQFSSIQSALKERVS